MKKELNYFSTTSILVETSVLTESISPATLFYRLNAEINSVASLLSGEFGIKRSSVEYAPERARLTPQPKAPELPPPTHHLRMKSGPVQSSSKPPTQGTAHRPKHNWSMNAKKHDEGKNKAKKSTTVKRLIFRQFASKGDIRRLPFCAEFISDCDGSSSPVQARRTAQCKDEKLVQISKFG